MPYPVSGVLVCNFTLWTFNHSRKELDTGAKATVLRKPLNMRYNK